VNRIGLGLALCSCLWVNFAHAAPSTLSAEIQRTPEALSCPDEAELWHSVNALFGQELVQPATAPAAATLAVRVVVERHEAGFRAIVQAEAEPTLGRSIVDPSPDCRGLADALAVALVLLVEPDATPLPRTAPHRAVPHEPPITPAPTPVRRSVDWSLDLAAVAGAGLLGNWDLLSVGGLAGGALHYESFGLRVRALRLVTPPDSFEEGRVHLGLWAGSFGPCWRFQLRGRWSLSPCVELGIGAQKAEPRNFEVQQARTAPWRVVTVGLTLLAPIDSLLYAHASLGGALRLHREHFIIDGRVAEAQPWVAPFVSVGLSVGGTLMGAGR